jgi:hypothetical protein
MGKIQIIIQYSTKGEGPGGSVSSVVGLPNNSYIFNSMLLYTYYIISLRMLIHIVNYCIREKTS